MTSRILQASLCRACAARSVQLLRPTPLPRQSIAQRRSLHVSRPLLATPPPMTKASDISMDRYHKLSDATMDKVLESLEALLDELGEAEFEVDYSSGVLTLKVGEQGTYVLNKQPPNKQIWLSSPFSGPKRYDYVESLDGWYYSRDNQSIESLLDEELSTVFGREVKLGVESISEKIEK